MLRELQPVLKTLNEKSNALVFEAKDKRSRAEEGETMKKWLVTIAALWLAGCSSGEINKTITSYLWCRAVHKVPPAG